MRGRTQDQRELMSSVCVLVRACAAGGQRIRFKCTSLNLHNCAKSKNAPHAHSRLQNVEGTRTLPPEAERFGRKPVRKLTIKHEQICLKVHKVVTPHSRLHAHRSTHGAHRYHTGTSSLAGFVILGGSGNGPFIKFVTHDN